MKTLTQHIEEKLKINKDFKFTEVQRIIDMFDDNFKKERAVDGNPGFEINNNNRIENYNTIVDVLNSIGTTLNGPISVIKDIMDECGVVVGWYDLEDGEVPSGDVFYFVFNFAESFGYGTAVIIFGGSHLESIRAKNEDATTAYHLLKNKDNVIEIPRSDFMTILEYIVNHGGNYTKTTLKFVVDEMNKK